MMRKAFNFILWCIETVLEAALLIMCLVGVALLLAWEKVYNIRVPNDNLFDEIKLKLRELLDDD
jgi:hypothetical protein